MLSNQRTNIIDTQNIILRMIAEYSQIEEQNKIGRDALKNTLLQHINQLLQYPLGSCSPVFIEDPIFKKYVNETISSRSIEYWFIIEIYLMYVKTNRMEMANRILVKLESKIQDAANDKKRLFLGDNIFTIWNMEARQTLSEWQFLTSPVFLKPLYLSGNDSLIKLVSSRLPIPPAFIFAGHPLPRLLAEREDKRTAHILNAIGNGQVRMLERVTIKLQRHIRAKRRQREEVYRLQNGYSFFIGRKYPNRTADELIQDANTPYHPVGCEEELAKRLVLAAGEVKLFSSILHRTNPNALTSIFNDGLFGRETLQKLGLYFQPSTLAICDVRDGDYNVICCAPQQIDPSCQGSEHIEITFDFQKIDVTNPCIFFKQRDFGYDKEFYRKVLIRNLTWSFSHTNEPDGSIEKMMELRIESSALPGKVAVKLPKPLFVSYNVKAIHQILTLNFFRFIDELYAQGQKNPELSHFAKHLYSTLAALSDEQLVETLENIGKHFSDTAEFNFYGAYRMNLLAITTLKVKDYQLNMSELRAALSNGDTQFVKTAMIHIPALFKSYRFMDYLQSIAKTDVMIDFLNGIRKVDVYQPLWLSTKNN